jgi:hypothetical protein
MLLAQSIKFLAQLGVFGLQLAQGGIRRIGCSDARKGQGQGQYQRLERWTGQRMAVLTNAE